MHNLYRSTGAIWPMSIPTSMTWLDMGALLNLIHNHQVRTVVEIGTHRGGFASLLAARTVFDPGFRFWTVEIDRGIIDPKVLAVLHDDSPRDFQAARLVIDDAFGFWVRDGIVDVLSKTNGTALLFCDGGDKPREMRELYTLLRPGDLMVGHDYHNEYNDESLPIAATLERLTYDWLDDTLLVAYRKV